MQMEVRVRDTDRMKSIQRGKRQRKSETLCELRREHVDVRV